MLNRIGVGPKVSAGFALLLLILAASSGATSYSVGQALTLSTTVEEMAKKVLLANKMEDALDPRSPAFGDTC